MPAFKKEPLAQRTLNCMGIIDMAYNRYGNMLAVSCMDSTIKLWDVVTSIILSNLDEFSVI